MPDLERLTATDWKASITLNEQEKAIKSLEEGNVLFFPHLAFSLLPHEEKFLDPCYAHPKAKNISFNRQLGSLRSGASPDEVDQLKQLLLRFSEAAEALVRQCLPSYVNALQVGRTSLRVVEVAGRRSSYRKDDTRLHVDAFPATPNQGKRILRVFSNVNLNNVGRVWRLGEPFQEVAKRFVPQVPYFISGYARLLQWFKLTKSYRTEYDHMMLHIHDKMKADLNYQKSVSQTEISFSPQTTWMVFTDCVSHAAMSGQHMFEQTFYLPAESMSNPSLSPLFILEKLANRPLIC